jgi:hypothetical protein
VGYAVLFAIAVVVALVQHGLLATWSFAPDLPLALVAWSVVAGNAGSMALRAWLVGLARDLIDPGSLCFHTVAYLALALAFLPVRSHIHHGRAAGWMVFAASSCLLLLLIDRAFAGVRIWLPVSPLIMTVVLTALFTWPVGWALQGLPAFLRPTGESHDAKRGLV